MRVNVRHSSRLRPFEQKHRPVRASRKGGYLWEQPAVHDRCREVHIRLPFDDDAAVDDVITDVELFEVDCEVFGVLDEIQKDRVSLRVVDAESISPSSGVRDLLHWR